jgi:hypothetical protein
MRALAVGAHLFFEHVDGGVDDVVKRHAGLLLRAYNLR